MFGKAKWIWMNNSPKPDEYADFFVDFDFDGAHSLFKETQATGNIDYSED